MSEDEALARALQASLAETQGAGGSNLSQEEQDRLLALSLAQGEQGTQPNPTTTASSNDKSCQIS